jgi:hypothetical protein
MLTARLRATNCQAGHHAWKALVLAEKLQIADTNRTQHTAYSTQHLLCVHAPRTLLPYSMQRPQQLEHKTVHFTTAALLMSAQQTTLHQPSCQGPRSITMQAPHPVRPKNVISCCCWLHCCNA